MALFNNTCPMPGDLDNTLLAKIAQSLCEGGGGSVAGVTGLSVNGGPFQTGQVSITTGGVTSVNGDPGPAVLLDSGDIPEGANLYYTQGRFDSAFAAKTTTDLTEGANLYFTNARAIASTLTGFVAAPGTVTAADTILSALEKVVGNAAAAGPYVLKAGDTMSGPLRGANGSAAAPMFSFSTDTDTGIYTLGANSVGITTGGVLRAAFENTQITFIVPLFGPAGTAAAPAFTFAGDSDTGLFRPGANILGISAGGVVRVTVDTASVTSTLPFLGANGTAAAPTFSFSGDPDNGMYLSAANVVGLSAAGTERVTLSSTALSTTVQVRGAAGSAVLPTFSFTSDVDMGMFRSSAGAIGFATGGTERLTLSSTLITATVPIQQSDSLALGADPTAATTQWADAGEWQYRSSAASEGAGQTNRVHNRAAQVGGAGTDYALTTTPARIDFGTTDPEIVLPTAGTYLLLANVTFLFNVVAFSAGDLVQWFFHNETDATGIAGDAPLWTNPSATLSNYTSSSGSATVTVAASKTINLRAQNYAGARGVVYSFGTNIRYVRLS